MESDVEPQGTEGDDEERGAVSPLEVLSFLRNAAGRHKVMGILTGVGVATLGIAVALVIPARFDAETRILFNPTSAVAPALSSPIQQRSTNIDPFSGATELIMQKENLLRIVEQADLLKFFKTNRTVPQRIKDAVMAPLSSPLSNERLKVSLAETLEKRMFSFHTDKLLTIHVSWSNPDMTLKLTQLAQASYLEMRRLQELSVIQAAIAINEDELKRAAQGIEQALGEVVRVRELSRAAALKSTKSPATNVAGGRASGRSKLPLSASTVVTIAPDKRLTAQLAEVRQRIQEIETPWQRRQADLKFQLNDLRGTFGPEHPTVLQQEAKIRDASISPPELLRLREDERRILAELDAPISNETQPTKTASSTNQANISSGASQALPTPAKLLGSSATLVIAEREDDPVVAPARANLASAIQRYNEVTRRLDAARLELTSEQAALQYRYSVVAQPERPIRPTKPNRPLLVVAALGVAVILGLLVGAIRDLLSGRVFEPWQIKSTGLAILGAVDLRDKARNTEPGG